MFVGPSVLKKQIACYTSNIEAPGIRRCIPFAHGHHFIIPPTAYTLIQTNNLVYNRNVRHSTDRAARKFLSTSGEAWVSVQVAVLKVKHTCERPHAQIQRICEGSQMTFTSIAIYFTLIPIYHIFSFYHISEWLE